MKKKYYYSCSIEEIGIAEEDGFITDVYFRGVRDVEADVCETDLIRKCFEEIEEYLCGKRKKFSVPVKAKGTDFQKKVWNALLHIEYGDMASYGDIARKIRSPKAFRAVGMANNRNPVMILIPCHRVVGSDGSLTGYAGGVEIKKKLLEMEEFNSNCENNFPCDIDKYTVWF